MSVILHDAFSGNWICSYPMPCVLEIKTEDGNSVMFNLRNVRTTKQLAAMLHTWSTGALAVIESNEKEGE